MTTELLPCPFCGADAAFETVLDSDPGQRWYACNECYASTRPAITPEESRAAWNRRASVAASPEPVREPVAWKAEATMSDPVRTYVFLAQSRDEVMQRATYSCRVAPGAVKVTPLYDAPVEPQSPGASRCIAGCGRASMMPASEYCPACASEAMDDASPAERVEGSTMDGAEGQPSGRALADMETADRLRSGPPIPSETQAEPPSTLPTDALTDEECDAAIFRSRFNVANAGTFPQRVDYDRALYRDAYRAGFAARVAALGALLQRLLS